MKCDPDGTWYHGTPCQLKTLRVGSTITRNRDLARVFSHKPTLVSVSDGRKIRHNGTRPGYLYRVVEEIRPCHVYPRPRSSMAEGQEWLTARELRVQLVEATSPVGYELLTQQGCTALWARAGVSDQ